MKKKKTGCSFLLVLFCLTGVGALIWLLFKDKIMELVFNSKYEDQILKLMDVLRLVWDLVNWPIDFVRALLP